MAKDALPLNLLQPAERLPNTRERESPTLKPIEDLIERLFESAPSIIVGAWTEAGEEMERITLIIRARQTHS